MADVALVSLLIVLDGARNAVAVARRDPMEVIVDQRHQRLVDGGAHPKLARRGEGVGSGRDRGAARQRIAGRADGIDAEADAFATAGQGLAGRIVDIQLERYAAPGDAANFGDQRERALRREQAARVVERDGIDAALDQLAGLAQEHLVGMNRADREADRRVHLETVTMGAGDVVGDVGEVVEAVDLQYPLEADLGQALHQEIDDLVGELPPAEQIAAAHQTHQRGVRHLRLDPETALPGVFVEEIDGGIEARAARRAGPDEAGPIDHARDRQHVLGAHARSPQRQLAIAHRLLDNPKLSRHRRNPLNHG